MAMNAQVMDMSGAGFGAPVRAPAIMMITIITMTTRTRGGNG